MKDGAEEPKGEAAKGGSLLVKVAASALILIAWAVFLFAAWKRTIPYARVNADVPSGKSGLPYWMPGAWGESFFGQISLKKGDVIFGGSMLDDGSLSGMRKRIEENPWIAGVGSIRRNFRGEFAMEFRVNRPVCLLKNKDELRFCNMAGEAMKLILDAEEGGAVLLDEQGREYTPPVVDIESILDSDKEKLLGWVRDIALFIRAWEDDPRLRGRMRLLAVNPSLYSADDASACILVCSAEDLTHKNRFRIEWGVNSEEKNLWEDKSNAMKRDELAALAQNARGPLPDINLRFRNDFF